MKKHDLYDKFRINASVCLFVMTKNRSKMLKKMLNSIKIQSFKNFKCIILDNGSEDDTELVVTSMELDARFEWAPWPAADPAANFRRAITLGLERFEWFAMLHDDDWLEPDWLELAWGAASAQPGIAFVSVNARALAEDGAQAERTWYPDVQIGKIVQLPDRESVARWMFRYGSIHFPSILYRAECFRDWEFLEPFGKYSDQYWLLEMASRGGCAIVATPAYCYRIHPGQDSAVLEPGLVWALHDYIESCVKFGINPIKRIEKNRSLIRTFRMFTELKKGYSLSELMHFMIKQKILLIGLDVLKIIVVDFITGYSRFALINNPKKQLS